MTETEPPELGADESRGKPRTRHLTGRLPYLGRTPSVQKLEDLKRRSLAHAQRAFWEKIVPGAVERAEKGNATALRFLLSVVRDPALRRPVPRPVKSTRDRVEEYMKAQRRQAQSRGASPPADSWEEAGA